MGLGLRRFAEDVCNCTVFCFFALYFSCFLCLSPVKRNWLLDFGVESAGERGSCCNFLSSCRWSRYGAVFALHKSDLTSSNCDEPKSCQKRLASLQLSDLKLAVGVGCRLAQSILERQSSFRHFGAFEHEIVGTKLIVHRHPTLTRFVNHSLLRNSATKRVWHHSRLPL